MIITHHDLQISLRLVANANREAIIDCFRQIFDELGLAIHKYDSSRMVHWPGGQFYKVLNTLAAAPNRGYYIRFESLGDPRVTAVIIFVTLGYDLLLHPKAKTQEKLDRFTQKFRNVSRERNISYVTCEQWQLQQEASKTI